MDKARSVGPATGIPRDVHGDSTLLHLYAHRTHSVIHGLDALSCAIFASSTTKYASTAEPAGRVTPAGACVCVAADDDATEGSNDDVDS